MTKRATFARILFLFPAIAAFSSGANETQENSDKSFHLFMLATRSEDPGLRFIEQNGKPSKVSYIDGPLLQYRKGDMTYYDRPGVFVDPRRVAIGVGGKLVILESNGHSEYVEATKSVTNIFVGQAPGEVYFVDGRKLSKYYVNSSRVVTLCDLGDLLEKIGSWYSTTNNHEINDGRLDFSLFTFAIDEASNRIFVNPHFLDLQIFSYGLVGKEFHYIVAGALPSVFYLKKEPRLFFSDVTGIAKTDLEGKKTPEYIFKYRYRVSNFKMLDEFTCYIQTEDVFGFFPQASGILGFKILKNDKVTWFRNHVYPEDIYLINEK